MLCGIIFYELSHFLTSRNGCYCPHFFKFQLVHTLIADEYF